MQCFCVETCGLLVCVFMVYFKKDMLRASQSVIRAGRRQVLTCHCSLNVCSNHRLDLSVNYNSGWAVGLFVVCSSRLYLYFTEVLKVGGYIYSPVGSRMTTACANELSSQRQTPHLDRIWGM